MRVVVCGGGMGGLVLAHALARHAEVVVLERDIAAAATGGYRISLDDEACRTIRTHLPVSLVEEVRSISDTGSAFEQFTIADSRLRPIVVAPEDPSRDRILAQRQALRVLLARDLDPTISFGSTVAAVVQNDAGAAVTLTDGRVVEGDLVVAADGADSAVVASLLGQTPTRDLGLTGIAGSSPLSEARLPDYLRHGPALAFAADGACVFMSLSRPSVRHSDDPALAALGGSPSLIWGLIVRTERVASTRDATPKALVDDSLRLLTRWHPWLIDHVTRSTSDRTGAFRFRAIDPRGPIADWTPGRVTALGDAVHAMPPTGGRGASTAIADAGELAVAIRTHLEHGVSLDQVLHRYQRALVPRARAAVRESLGPVRIINALRRRPLQLLAAPMLAAAGRLGDRRYSPRP